MKIAHVLPYGAKFPLQKHNGRYEWVLRLATLQAKAGLEPIIYSHTASFIDITGVTWRSIPAALPSKTETNKALFLQAFSDPDVAVFHSHFDSLHFEVAAQTNRPIVATQHWFPTQPIAETAVRFPSANVTTVPVTRYMAAEDAELGIAATAPIYHGIDLKLFRPADSPTARERLLVAGRIAPHKGLREAVEFALEANEQLDIIGKINAPDQAYWDQILPKVDGKTIRYLGPKTQAEVAQAMRQAKALLFAGKGLEAFGQTIVEAQACGTPVVAWNVGANSELIDNGVSGFTVDTDASFLKAIADAERLDPEDCRRKAEQFDVTRMTAEYTELYRKLAG